MKIITFLYLILTIYSCKNEIDPNTLYSSAAPVEQIDYGKKYLSELDEILSDGESYFLSIRDMKDRDARIKDEKLKEEIVNYQSLLRDVILSSDQELIYTNLIERKDLLYSNIEYSYNNTINNLADMCSTKIVDDSWQGGENISHTVESYFFTDNNQIELKISLSFYGQLSGDYYNAEGIIRYNIDNNQFNFNPTYKNEAVVSWENIMGAITTGAVIYSAFNDN